MILSPISLGLAPCPFSFKICNFNKKAFHIHRNSGSACMLVITFADKNSQSSYLTLYFTLKVKWYTKT